MISALISLALSVGLPAILTGVLGKWTSWLNPLKALAPFIGVIVQLCVGLVDALLKVVNWILDKILKGLDHIVKSVPATFTLIVFMWIAYSVGDGGILDTIPEFPKWESSEPAPPVDRSTYKTPGDWIKEVLGVE